VGRQQGVTEEQLRALAGHEDAPVFSALEHAALRLSDAMTATPVVVPDTLFAELRRHLDERQVLELASAIAWENYRARLDHALEVPAEGYSEGAFCPLPVRAGSGHG
jgi:alkylhydroperoxidase family enzyme